MEQMSLFGNNRAMTPLASRLRPDSLDDFAGSGASCGKREDPETADRERPDLIHDLLGASGRGKDDPCKYHSRKDEVGIC